MLEVHVAPPASYQWEEQMGKRKEYSYDEKCEELARYFLDEGAEIYTEDNIKELSQNIQNSIEDWLDYKVRMDVARVGKSVKSKDLKS